MTNAAHLGSPVRARRRQVISGLAAGAQLFLARHALGAAWHNIDISGSFPRLSFTMTDATNGRQVTAAAVRGKLVLLYFGYTQCPDVCPLTLHNVSLVLERLAKPPTGVAMLFVTVDPDRDTLPVLRQYTAAFSPQTVGLRGSANQLARLAREYRIAYSVSPATSTHPYEVTHSSAIFVFDRDGYPRLLVPSLGTTAPDLNGTAADLARLLRGSSGGLLTRVIRMLSP
ncbi:MAG TPA: SCO family protein [Acetobacteraceae bacterium]|nr:SCO family protein [Acetobacteraceae bacterium]